MKPVLAEEGVVPDLGVVLQGMIEALALHVLGSLDSEEIKDCGGNVYCLGYLAAALALQAQARVPDEEGDVGYLVVVGHHDLAPPVVLA